jgi:hypothetical protein
VLAQAYFQNKLEVEISGVPPTEFSKPTMVCLFFAKVPLRGIRNKDYSPSSSKGAKNPSSSKGGISIGLSPDYNLSFMLCYGKAVEE